MYSNLRSDHRAPNRYHNVPPAARLPTLPIEVRENVVRHYVNDQESELVWNDDGTPANQIRPPLRHMRRPVYPSIQWWHPQRHIMDGADVRNHPTNDRRPGREETPDIRREVLANLVPLLSTNREMRVHAVRSFWDETWVNVEISSGRHSIEYTELPNGGYFPTPVVTSGSDSRLRSLVRQLSEPVAPMVTVPTITPHATLGDHIRRLSIRFDHALPPYSGRQELVAPWESMVLNRNIRELLLRTPNVRCLELYFDTDDTLQGIDDDGVLEAIAEVLDERISRQDRLPLRSIVFRGGECRDVVLTWRRRFPGIRIHGLVWTVNPYLMVHYQQRWVANELPIYTAPPRWVGDDEVLGEGTPEQE
ncbi:hypothetical protein ACRALDRAFT_1073155 [Sodiomyces alcalophilus JCM 7366]|uniref:uncharacterized protein n=1 Tax=Sodiomyces alcalophilus JCM 7366 TaxID=591952 RepID=UPI0039B58E0B